MVTGVAYSGAINAAALRHGLDPSLLAAVAAQETGGPGSSSGRNIVGDGGHGHGVFQIDDRSHPFATTAAAMDPAQNAEYAAGLLRQNLDATHGDVRGALSMYNTGSATATGTTTTWGGQTLGYADSVLAHQAQIAGGTTAAADLRADGGTTASGVNLLQSFMQMLTGQSASSASSDSQPAQSDVTIAMPSADASTTAFKGADSKQVIIGDADKATDDDS
jgi:hypothetical protein